jgi:hypothetical protein
MQLRNGTAGNSLVYRFWITTVTNDPFDLTGCKIVFTIKRSTQDTKLAALCSLAVGSGIAFTYTAADGTVDVTIPSIVTAAMRILRPYYWDLTIQDTAGIVSTPYSGTISVTAPVSTYTAVGS